MAEDTAALVRALGIDVADFAGYSMGGGVALQDPSLVRRLVLFGGVSYDQSGLDPQVLQAFTTSSPRDLDGSTWHQSYVKVAPDPDAWPALVGKVGDLDRSFAGWTASEVQQVRAPALLIIGDSDIVRPEHTVQMFRLLGGGVVGDLAVPSASQLAVLPGTSHVGLLDRVDYLQLILEFLDGA
jgi:pimeloyl-ACP methyl ester carboxylesterase